MPEQMSQSGTRTGEDPPLGSNWLLVVCSLFLIVFAVRLLMIDAWGSPVPILDQWDLEPALYNAWLDGTLSLKSFIGYHNEHPVITVRVWLLGLFILGGGWDPMFQIICGNALNALLYALLGYWLGQACQPRVRPLVWLLAAIIGACPIGTINMLGGMQACFYLGLLFQLTGLWLLIRPAGWAIWAAGLCMLLGCLTLGNGPVGPAVCVLILTVRWCHDRWSAVHQPSLKPWFWVGAFLLMGGISLYLSASIGLKSQPEPKGFGQVFTALKFLLSLPFPRYGWFFLLGWLPAALLVIKATSQRRPLDADEWFMLAVLAWSFANACGTALARSEMVLQGMGYYFDNISPGLLVNGAILARLLGATHMNFAGKAWRLAALGVVCLAWALGIGWGLAARYQKAPQAMAGRIENFKQMRENVVGYLSTGDERWITSRGMVPYFTDPRHMKALLDDPKIVRLLPRPLLPGGQSTNGNARPSEWMTEAIMAFTMLFLLLGGVGLMWGSLISWKSVPRTAGSTAG